MDTAPQARSVWRRRLPLAALGLVAWLGLRAAATRPDLVERGYCERVFPLLRAALGGLARHSPVAVAEVVLAVAVGAVLVAGVRGLRRWRSRSASGRGLLAGWFSAGLAWAGVLYTLFVLLWGLNHSRRPYAWHAGLEGVEPGSSREQALEALGRELVERCNALRAELDASAFELELPDPRLVEAYERLAQRVPALAGPPPIVRQPWVSPILSRLGITGIYSPFTCECHVNAQMPTWRHAFTALHEVAHARGFAREDEANFIAWQAGCVSPDPALQYSVSASAFGPVFNALARTEPGAALGLLESLSAAVLEDFDLSRKFWSSKHSPVTLVASSTNDLYLKSQGQGAGVASYGRMVELLLAEWWSREQGQQ